MIEPDDTTSADRRPFGGPPLPPQAFGTWLYAPVQAWRCRSVVPHQVPRLVVLAGRDDGHGLAEHGLGISQRLRWLQRQSVAPLRRRFPRGSNPPSSPTPDRR